MKSLLSDNVELLRVGLLGVALGLGGGLRLRGHGTRDGAVGGRTLVAESGAGLGGGRLALGQSSSGLRPGGCTAS